MGSNFRWSESSTFAYTLQNHTSVVGLRAYAIEAGASVKPCIVGQQQHCNTQEQEHSLLFSSELCTVRSCESLRSPTERKDDGVNCNTGVSLFAFPGEDNFSGQIFDVDALADAAKDAKGRWYVLVDAARYAACFPIDLSKHRSVDFMSISFYKIFGFPTGVGALIARRSALSEALCKKYFGGGTVRALDPFSHFVRLKKPSTEEAWEDGTIPYDLIPMLLCGLQKVERIGMQTISSHVVRLTAYTVHSLQSLRHSKSSGGRHAVLVYGHPSLPSGTTPYDGVKNSARQGEFGGIIAFNVIAANGSIIGYTEVERVLRVNRICVRVGCFCNPGKHQIISNDFSIIDLRK